MSTEKVDVVDIQKTTSTLGSPENAGSVDMLTLLTCFLRQE